MDGLETELVYGHVCSHSKIAFFDANDMAENFSEMEHGHSIRSEDRILTAAGEGKVSFVSADDIAAVAFRALTDEVLHNTDHLILGPELFSYDDVRLSPICPYHTHADSTPGSRDPHKETGEGNHAREAYRR